MPRPCHCRYIGTSPTALYFKPRGIPLSELDEVILHLDEFEAIRLKDHLGLDQTAAAQQMKISQPTFFRILTRAHKKIADALVQGKAVKIEGGKVQLD